MNVTFTSQAQKTIEQAIHAHLWNDILPSAYFYVSALPLLLMFAGGLVAMLSGGIGRAKITNPLKPHSLTFGIAIFFCFLAAAVGIICPPGTSKFFLGGSVLIDSLANTSFVIIAFGTLFTLMASSATQVGRNLLRAELTALLLFSSAGLMTMCCAGEFMSFFIGLEITSISLYVLVGYERKDTRAMEAAIKYFLLGSVAASFLLLGAALIYASIGSLYFSDFHLLKLEGSHPFALLGFLFVLCGLAFKMGMAPFHAWTPDVYQGANSHLSGYMSSLVKLSIVIVFIRILSKPFSLQGQSNLVLFFWVLAVLSVAVGSLFGLVHNSVKRIFAWSSVANAGYFCLGFAALVRNPASVEAKRALISYALIYAVLSLGAFTVLAWFEDMNREDLLKEELAGMGAQKPFAAFALSVFLFGFAGIPPVAGFFGKFFLVFSAVHQGLVGLGVILVMLSVFSLYYYLSLMVDIWFKPATRHSVQNNQTAQTNSMMKALCFFAVVAAFLTGLFSPS